MKNGFGIAAMITGIIGLITSATVFGGVLCLVALVLSIIGLCQKGKKRGTAVAGLVCSAVGMLVFLVVIVILGLAIGSSSNKDDEDPTNEIVTEQTTDEEPTTEESTKEEPTKEEATTQEPTTEEKNENEFVYEDLKVVYKESKIEKDKSGKDCLVVYFDYTNNSDENQAFLYAFTVTVFQNGVELDGSWFQVNEETENDDKKIQPGTTITVAQAFTLNESRDAATIQVTPWISLSENILFEKQITLN